MYDATFYESPDEGAQYEDSAFAFVRNDGALLHCKPKWNDRKIEAKWFDDKLATALAAETYVFDQGLVELGVQEHSKISKSSSKEV